MPFPEPMLSTPARAWPSGGDWIQQPKWDGFRLLVDVGQDGRLRAWSRHGTGLTDRLDPLMEAFGEVPGGTIFDGELVALGERGGQATQDFAAVSRAVLSGVPEATRRLRFVAFDLLALHGEDLRARPWHERDGLLRAAAPTGERVRLISSQPADRAAYRSLVALGFEGVVLKRHDSAYRPGRQASWVKVKARHRVESQLRAVYQDHEGRWQATCEVNGRRVRAIAAAKWLARVNEPVAVVYSRVDADGGLREARLTGD